MTYSPQEMRGGPPSGPPSDRDSVDDSPSQRKRIAVACGRCRKRKIRCTGDSGTGEPCQNCKTSGYQPCQFLRVSSQETSFNGEGVSHAFELNPPYQTHGAPTLSNILPTLNPYMDSITSASPDGMAYRSSSASSGAVGYPYAASSSSSRHRPHAQAQHYYPLGFPPASAYTEDQSPEYPVYPSYPSVHEPSYMMGGSYRMNTGAARPGTAMYIEPDPNYGYGAGSRAGGLTHRSTAHAAAGDSSSDYVFHGVDAMSSSLSNSTGNGRLSPLSGLPRLSSTLDTVPQHQHSLRNDSTSPSYIRQVPSQSSIRSAASPETSPTGFGSFDSSYPMAASAMRGGHSGLYTTSGAAGSASATDHVVSGTHHRATLPDLTYRYTDTTRQPAAGSAGELGMANETAAYMANHDHHQHNAHISYMVPSNDNNVDSDLAADRKVIRSTL
ncbi:hypothetical protein B0I35DRAFT_474474 [Stachybotrys elegans]|uniref:Zn(2)-C6 fungal-type domain-containing protein n=1 Tax=Stachybotrys elegans TaxID=80388 RepID=A0A8K0SXA4_9HYPO|nr:hypothetical protein B0I35DRAFT_474474 [Stachybotrys elegans]